MVARSTTASVERPLWHALMAYRLLTLGYAAALCALHYGRYTHPTVAVCYVVGLGGWTLATLRHVSSAERCGRTFLVADLAVAITGILLTNVVHTAEQVADGVSTLPSVWTAGAVLAFAVKGGWRWAAGAATLIGASNVVQSGSVTPSILHNTLLLWVASIAIGYVVEVARASERTLARAVRIEAATRERERLARDIHDGVLQVLAMAQRRGAELGGEAAELGRLAGEQEVALRALVSSGVPAGSRQAVDPPRGAERRAATRGHPASEGAVEDPGAECDLRSLLLPYSGPRVSVVEPGAPVPLPAGTATELAAAVGAALDNVRQHTVGPDGTPARAWVLVEDEPEAVLVTVRDEGPGIPEGRLRQAEREGRLGVALSLRGRLRDLGGTAVLESTPGQGTEVELRVPRTAAEPG